MLKIKDNKIELTGEIEYRNLTRFIDGNNFVELNVRTDYLKNKEVESLLKELQENYKYNQVKIIVEKIDKEEQ